MFLKICLCIFLLSFEAKALDSFAPVVEKVMPSVVNISTELKENEDSPNIENSLLFSNDGHVSLGSGFFADEEGYILTNRHVVEKAKQINVTTYSGKVYRAEIKGEDEILDVALLKVDAQNEIAPAKFADSDNIKVGDWIVAVGNPFGLSNSVTSGIVSAKSRNINETPFDDYIQTDAPINPGNSGGPMFDLNGEVVGLNTLIFSKQGNSLGVGFAIPSNQLKPIYESLKENGKAVRSSIGVRLKEIEQDNQMSIIVTEIMDFDLAKENDLAVGDVILSYDDKAITNLRTFEKDIIWREPNTYVKMQIKRDDQIKENLIRLKEITEKEKAVSKSEPIADEGTFYKQVGLFLDGNKVVNVEAGSESAQKGIQKGDEIVKLNGHSVVDTGDIKFYIAESVSEQKKLRVDLMDVSGNEYFVDLVPNEAE